MMVLWTYHMHAAGSNTTFFIFWGWKDMQLFSILVVILQNGIVCQWFCFCQIVRSFSKYQQTKLKWCLRYLVYMIRQHAASFDVNTCGGWQWNGWRSDLIPLHYTNSPRLKLHYDSCHKVWCSNTFSLKKCLALRLGREYYRGYCTSSCH